MIDLPKLTLVCLLMYARLTSRYLSKHSRISVRFLNAVAKPPIPRPGERDASLNAKLNLASIQRQLQNSHVFSQSMHPDTLKQLNALLDCLMETGDKRALSSLNKENASLDCSLLSDDRNSVANKYSTPFDNIKVVRQAQPDIEVSPNVAAKGSAFFQDAMDRILLTFQLGSPMSQHQIVQCILSETMLQRVVATSKNISSDPSLKPDSLLKLSKVGVHPLHYIRYTHSDGTQWHTGVDYWMTPHFPLIDRSKTETHALSRSMKLDQRGVCALLMLPYTPSTEFDIASRTRLESLLKLWSANQLSSYESLLKQNRTMCAETRQWLQSVMVRPLNVIVSDGLRWQFVHARLLSPSVSHTKLDLNGQTVDAFNKQVYETLFNKEPSDQEASPIDNYDALNVHVCKTNVFDISKDQGNLVLGIARWWMRGMLVP